MVCDLCGERSKYILEWYGVNQHGKNPLVVHEVSSCPNFEHIVEIMNSNSNKFGTPLDGIVDSETLDVEHPILTDLVNEAYQLTEKDEELYQRAQELIYREFTPNQLLLFSE